MRQTADSAARIPTQNDLQRDHDRLWTVRDVARFLGVHEKTVYDWTARAGLPCIRLGNRLRFDPADVLRWLSARKEG